MTLDYHEELPVSCPPADAVDAAYPLVIRFVDSPSKADLSDSDFKSFAALGLSCRPNIDPCRWASCSFFESTSCKGFITATKIPKLKRKYLAELKIPFGAGLSMRSEKGHIDFWRFSNFNPIHEVLKVRENEAA